MSYFISESKLLSGIFCDYLNGVANDGVIGDKLGDVFEKYVPLVLGANNNNLYPLDLYVKQKVLSCFNIGGVQSITSVAIPMLDSGGYPKTDLALNINERLFKSSIKQSKRANVAVAEFDVETILNGIGQSQNQNLKRLLLKHQEDASAKNFSPEEKDELTHLLSGKVGDDLIRWVMTGTSISSSNDIRNPDYIMTFNVEYPSLLERMRLPIKESDIKIIGFNVRLVSEYICVIRKKSGFGTGLSFTYATGSKGRRIQFKAPVI